MSTGAYAAMSQESRAEAGRQALRRASGQRSVTPPRRAAPRPEEPSYAHVGEELKADKLGRELGAKYGHDAYRLAAAEGVPVRHVPASVLQHDPGRWITGQGWKVPGARLIQIAQGLTSFEDQRVVGHEMAHLLGINDEGHCDLFAQRFMAVADDERPEGKAAKWHRELLEAARRGK